MKIATKISGMVVVTVIVMAVSLSGFVYRFQAKVLEAESRSDMRRMSQRLFDMINEFVTERIGDIKVIATATRITDENASAGEITARLIEFRDHYQCYDSIAIFDLNRVCFTDTTGLNVGKQHPLERFWLDPLNGKGLVINASRSRMFQMPTIYFSYPVRNASGKTFRIAVSRVPVSRIGEILKMRSEYLLEKEIDVDLVDRNGLLLYSDNDPRDILVKKPHYWGVVESRIKDKKKLIPFFFREGKDLIIVLPQPAYRDYKGNGWYLVLHIPVKIVMAPVVALGNRLMIIAGLFAVIACGVALLFGRIISRPIEKLRIASERFGAGDMDYRVSIKSGDEIEGFAGSFNGMAGEISKARQEIESYSKSLEILVEKRTEELKGKIGELQDAQRVVLSVLEDTLSELNRTQAQLLQAGKLSGIGQMAAGIAHEINNPLTSILGFAQLLLTDKNLAAGLRADLTVIEKEAKRSTTIIENLLNFARPTPAKKVEMDINNVVMAVMRVLEYSLRTEKVDVKTEYSPHLPKVLCDPAQMQQVFMNIIINAVNALRPKGGVLRISASQDRAEFMPSVVVQQRRENTSPPPLRGRNKVGGMPGDEAPQYEVVVSFTDTGVGMSDEVKARIFEPFFTTSYKEGRKGTGLGLAISYGIVKDHGGRIELESEVGKGSVFKVILPGLAG